MTDPVELPPLPEPVDFTVKDYTQESLYAGSGYTADQMNAHYLAGFEAGRARVAAPVAVPELLETFTTWARQVAAREDVPRGIRSAAANLHDDGKRLLAAAPSASPAELVVGVAKVQP